MARTKRPRTPSTGGRDIQLASSLTSNELAESLVEAHLNGFLGRKRVYAFEKRRLNQDLERCLKTNWETLKKRMNKGEETVEFCFEHNYYEYEPSEDEVREALPPDLKALSSLQWARSADCNALAFRVTVTGVRRPLPASTNKRDWVIGIEVDRDYLADARAAALTAALERGEDVEEE
jgi:hypothetical protein